MRLTAYATLLLSINIVFYLFGYTSLAGYYINTIRDFTNSSSATPVLNIHDTVKYIGATILNPDSIPLLFGIVTGGVAISVVALITGFSAMYLVPLIVVLLLSNIIFLPISFIFDPTMPFFLKLILMMIFNLLTALTAVQVIGRGGL